MIEADRWPSLCRAALRAIVPPGELEDAVQAACLRLVEDQARGVPPRNVLHVKDVARWAWVDMMRAKLGRSGAKHLTEWGAAYAHSRIDQAGDVAERVAEQSEAQHLAVRLRDVLTQRELQVLQLSSEGFTLEQIGAQLGLTGSRVSQIRTGARVKARRRLRWSA